MALKDDIHPIDIVDKLTKFIVGQNDAKKAIAIAIRQRWRRLMVTGSIKEEIYPKNILMIGPTGVGKTEISRRVAKLTNSPFIKVEATKFTEVGYVGRDVESIIRDLADIAYKQIKDQMKKDIHTKALQKAEQRIVSSLLLNNKTDDNKATYLKKLRDGLVDNEEIDIVMDIENHQDGMNFLDLSNISGQIIGATIDIFGNDKSPPSKKRKQKLKVKDALEVLVEEESDKIIKNTDISRLVIKKVEEEGIVVIDEIDKIISHINVRGGEVSREGVQRDLLPLIEGTTVTTKHGQIKTDYILFIASGAFHEVKPSDLLPELQGRLPVRVELSALNEDDFYDILTKTDNSLILQYKALLEVDKIHIEFTKDGMKEICSMAYQLNMNVENIGARRLHTIFEKLLEEINFNVPKNSTNIDIDKKYVEKHLKQLTDKSIDLEKFIL